VNVFWLLLFSIIASTRPVVAQQKVDRSKALMIGGTSVAAIGGLYAYFHQVWWRGEMHRFRFDFDRDLRYANNLDKMGHVMGGLMTADAYVDACRWIGMSDRQGAWWAFGMSTGLQAIIEVKDGFSPNYGFSVLDIGAGAAGALLPMARLHSSFFRHSDMKFSYWQRTQKYFNARPIPVTPFHIDDYLNQTYWMSTNLRYLLGERAPWVPDWLNLSIGWGIDADTWNTNRADPGTGGKAEIYLAPDIDLVRLFKPKKAFWKLTLKRLNYLKVPMPALQITPRVKGWGVYF
jgi:hypothetical protein